MKPAKLFLGAAAAFASMASYANIEWTGASTSETKYWNDAANWSGTETPYRFHYDTLQGTAQTVVFNTSETIESALWIENSLSGVITFTADSTDYGLTQPGNYGANIGTGTYGALAIAGGKYHFANDIVLGLGQWSNNARGDLTISAGRVETEYWLVMGSFWDSWHAGSQGNVTISGGELVVGCRDGAEADNALIEMGRAAQSTTTFTQTGGTVSSQSNGGAGQPAMIIANGANSSATYTISGGAYIARAGNVLMANGEGTTGTLNLNGGTFTTEAIVKGSGTATVNLDGGTLVATTDGTIVASGITLDVGANGGTIDTYGYNVEIAATVTGGGNITIKGGGSVSFTGDTSAWTGKAANFIVGASDSTVWLGNARISGSVHVAGSMKFGAPADISGCTFDFDFGTDDFDSNFTNLGGELTDSTINNRAAKHSDTFSVKTLQAQGCSSTFAVVQSLTAPSWERLFTSSDTGGTTSNPSRWMIGLRSSLRRWEKYIYGNWSGTDGLYQNGVAGCPSTNSPFVFSAMGQWTRYASDTVTLGGSNSMTWGEVLFYNREVTESERVGIEDYLMWKWGFNSAYTPLTAANALTMANGATLDLGGFDVTVSSFAGAGTVTNGTLRAANGVYTQSGGALTIPAVDGATYVASSSLESLVLTGGEGKSVKVRIPSDWYDSASATQGHAIFCEGDVTFEYDGWEPSETAYKMDNGWWHLYDTEEDADAEMDAELARQDALLDVEKDASGNPIAFPGARGFGRFALGARASSSPKVLHVTNLDDSGTGSLRWAVTQSNAIVVFDVAGIIQLKSTVVFGKNLYIAGQTAPGEGITVYGNRCSFSGSDNIICRHLRWRMGHIGPKGKDCAGIANGTNMIFDHCSFSWGRDETFSINPDGKGSLGNITLQNCIIGQGLMTHSAGGLMQADNITLYRNFYCDNKTRNNKLKGTIQYVNNTVYNWKNGCVILGGDSSGQSYCNITDNLFINGPAGGGDGLGGGNKLFHFYGEGNYQDKNADGAFEPYLVTTSGGGDQVSSPYNYPSLPAYPGYRLLDKHLPTVGASLPYRDPADYYMIDEIMSYGTDGKLITYETALPFGAPSTWSWWWAGETRTDTDGDGIPDDWEDANGLDKNSSSDATLKAANGYLNIENYINSLTAENRQFHLRAPLTPGRGGKTTSTITVTWRDYTEGEDGFEVSYKPYSGGSWTVAGTTEANATSFTIEGLDSGLYYSIRIRAFAEHDGSTVYSDYSSTVKLYTSAFSAAEVDIATFEPDVTYKRVANSQPWNKTDTQYWVENKAFRDGDKVLINQNSSGSGISLNVNETVSPGAVVVNGSGSITLNGNGNLSGAACSINKGNSGHLFLYGENTYEGPVINHGGTISFNKIANGGVASSLGKSQSFADNWIFDGGTYRFTGGTASTDRDALLKSSSVLEVKDKVLTMNGIFEGEGDFTLQGGGTLDIPNGSFFGYTGATILKGGTLSLSDANAATGSAMNFHPTQLVMAGGSLFIASDSGYQQDADMTLDIEVADNTTSTITIPGRGIFGGTISNATSDETDEEAEDEDGSGNDSDEYVYTGSEGALRINVPYSRAYIANDFSQFHGTIIGKCSHKDGRFLKNGSWNAPTTRFYLEKATASGATTYMSAYPANTTNKLGGLSGDEGTYLIGCSSGTSSTPCNWIVGYANTDETFNGVIDNRTWDLSHYANVSVTKVGTGYWRLNGDTEHRSGTTVNGGTLIMNGNNTGTGGIIVNNGGTLRGYGTIGTTITVNSGGTLFPGDPDVVADTNLYYSGAITLKSGSKLKIPVAVDGDGNQIRSRLRPTGSNKLNIESGVTLEFDLADGVALTEGQSISIASLGPNINAASSAVFDTILPATPGTGLKWDVSDLASGGKTVKVVTDPDYNPLPDTVAVASPVTGLSSTDADSIVANASVADPENAAALYSADIAAYKNVFVLVKSGPDSSGNYTVSAEITQAGTNTVETLLETAIEEKVGPLLANLPGATGDTKETITGIPGLYYSVSSGGSLTSMAEGDRTQAGRGGAVELTFPHYSNTGFYKILVNIGQ